MVAWPIRGRKFYGSGGYEGCNLEGEACVATGSGLGAEVGEVGEGCLGGAVDGKGGDSLNGLLALSYGVDIGEGPGYILVELQSLWTQTQFDAE